MCGGKGRWRVRGGMPTESVNERVDGVLGRIVDGLCQLSGSIEECELNR